MLDQCGVGWPPLKFSWFRGGMPLGNLIAGYVAQRWSISTALAVNGVVLAIVALVFIARRTKLDESPQPA